MRRKPDSPLTPANLGPIPIGDQVDEEEWLDYDEVKVEKGVEHDLLSKLHTQHIERTEVSPMTMIDQPVPNSFWLACIDHIKALIRKTMMPDLRRSREWALLFCAINHKSGVEGRRPAHEQFQFGDMLAASDPGGRIDQNAVRCLRETMYLVFNNEYLGRGVG